MSYATVPAYHVFMAAKAAMERITQEVRVRQQVYQMETSERLWWKWPPVRRLKKLALAQQEDIGRGEAIGRLMNLAVAATSVDPGASVALDEFDLELIRAEFFDPRLMAEVRSQMQFATLPGGHA